MSFHDFAEASRFQIGQNEILVNLNNIWFSTTALPFNMQPQTQTNWCWAATSTSVSHFYFALSGWTQCKVANGNLNLTNCCNSPVPGACNVSSTLQNALTVTHNFSSMVGSTITYAAILAELKAGRVVGARIQWPDGGGHFMVIYGVSRIGLQEFLHIDDPIYGKSRPTIGTFMTAYQGNGHWTHSYFTKRWPILRIKLPLLEAHLTDPIEKARPLLALQRGERTIASDPNLTLAVPHEVFMLDLKDIAGDQVPSLAKPHAMRVLEVDGSSVKAFYDLTPAQSGPSGLQSMSDDPDNAKLLESGLSAVQRIAEQSDAEPSLSFIRIPSLYVDAFWLHFPDSAKDTVVPIRGLGLLTPLEPLPAADFFARLREPARARLAAPSSGDMAP